MFLKISIKPGLFAQHLFLLLPLDMWKDEVNFLDNSNFHKNFSSKGLYFQKPICRNGPVFHIEGSALHWAHWVCVSALLSGAVRALIYGEEA